MSYVGLPGVRADRSGSQGTSTGDSRTGQREPGPPLHDDQRVPEKDVPVSANDRTASSSFLKRLRNGDL